MISSTSICSSLVELHPKANVPEPSIRLDLEISIGIKFTAPPSGKPVRIVSRPLRGALRRLKQEHGSKDFYLNLRTNPSRYLKKYFEYCLHECKQKQGSNRRLMRDSQGLE